MVPRCWYLGNSKRWIMAHSSWWLLIIVGTVTHLQGLSMLVIVIAPIRALKSHFFRPQICLTSICWNMFGTMTAMLQEIWTEWWYSNVYEHPRQMVPSHFCSTREFDPFFVVPRCPQVMLSAGYQQHCWLAGWLHFTDWVTVTAVSLFVTIVEHIAQ